MIKITLFIVLIIAVNISCAQITSDTTLIRLNIEKVRTDSFPEPVSAKYPKGNNGWKEFLKNHNYILDKAVSIAERKGIAPGEYKITITFFIDSKGEVANVNAISKIGFGLEEAAIKIIYKSPKWIPGEQGGRKIKSLYSQEFTVKIPGR